MNAIEHATARDRLIQRIQAELGADERFVAGWLGGSLGRGDGDDWSDIDLWLVVAEAAAGELCAGPAGMFAGLSPARSSLAGPFGALAVAGENSVNARPDGYAMNVIYRDPPIVVDWYLMPAATVARPMPSRLLFDHSGLPIAPEPTAGPIEERAGEAAHEVAMFWYFVAPVAKSIRRGEAVHALMLLQRMAECAARAERHARGEPIGIIRERQVRLAATAADQVAVLRATCERMVAVMPAVAAIGGAVPEDPMAWVERLLA